jgi:hypothetical protein
MLFSYTYSHAIDNVDPATAQNPNDPGKTENGNALFDQRQRLVISGFYIAPGKITIGGVNTMASALVYDIATGANNSGDGARWPASPASYPPAPCSSRSRSHSRRWAS